jgi:hypothetical protein
VLLVLRVLVGLRLWQIADLAIGHEGLLMGQNPDAESLRRRWTFEVRGFAVNRKGCVKARAGGSGRSLKAP